MAHTPSDLSPQEAQPKYRLDGLFSSPSSYGRSGRKTDIVFLSDDDGKAEPI